MDTHWRHTHPRTQARGQASMPHVLTRTKNFVSALKPSPRIVTILAFSNFKWLFYYNNRKRAIGSFTLETSGSAEAIPYPKGWRGGTASHRAFQPRLLQLYYDVFTTRSTIYQRRGSSRIDNTRIALSAGSACRIAEQTSVKHSFYFSQLLLSKKKIFSSN